MKRIHLLGPALLLSLAVGCSKDPPPQPTQVTSAPPPAPPKPKLDKVPRAEFNRLAAELALPLFWSQDKNKDNTLDPDELAVYWGLQPGAVLGEYVGKDGFTAKMTEAYDAIAKRHAAPPKEDERLEAVKKELAQGRLTLLETDLSKASPEEKRFVGFIVKAAEIVDKLYAMQLGTWELSKKIADQDTASKTLFFRTHGFKCEGPKTKDDPNCNALPLADMPKEKLSGLYPTDLLTTNAKFCDDIAKKKKDPAGNEFTVVVKNDKGELDGKPYTEVYKTEMTAVAGQLKAAAEALGDKEERLKEYLLAAAKGFETNDWWPADEAWAHMDTKNSKYFLRIAPDEVYKEPCSVKALFHVSFALVNQGSLKWQEKLDPIKGDMEKALAELAGPPYKARDVKFKLPDFIDVALNAGDSRPPFGATIGQSLPNFGPVAKKGGRTVAMTNLYTDPDSIESAKGLAESLFCKDTMTLYTTNPEPQVMSTVLHEAAHNLGPSHEYEVNGKVDRSVFGGPLASTLEELKAQTSALYFTDWLVEKKQITREEADKAHVRDMYWAFGHISRGMYTSDKKPMNYSQLAAIQVGHLIKNGAVVWKADEDAANGKDKGCFSVVTAKMPAAIATLMKDVAQVKGKGDKARAEALIKEFVDMTDDKKGEKKKVHEVITERMTRAPKASFVYAIKLD
jgi:hypothetical protein